MLQILLYLVLFQNVLGYPRVDPLVLTNVGLIRGLKADDGDYSMFLGIPYAKVEETNPFGASVPYPLFEEEFGAYNDSAVCPQLDEFSKTITGTLDCLHLNIYVPNSANSNNRVPVFIWIHGGGFQMGFAGRYQYGPKYLVRHDVILVTLNYRLGAYGFLSLDTPEIPGNQGLKDQLLALRWIHDNIESFGGDVNKITLFGESAGGVSVDFHLYYTQEKLFNQVIMQSGNALAPWPVRKQDISSPLKLSKHLGYPTTDVADALRFLSQSEPSLIVSAAIELNIEFWPCVENDFDDVENFIVDHPVNTMLPQIKSTPILLGYNNDEMLMSYLQLDSAAFDNLNVFHDELNAAFDFDEQELIEMEEIVHRFYIGDEKISINRKWEIIDFESDISFNYPTERSIQKYLENGAETVFHYVFSYSGGRNNKNRLNITIGGASHADEINYLFDPEYLSETPQSDDQLVIDRMTALWTNFVKYGNPTPETSELLPVKWEPVSKDTLHYLNIDAHLHLESRPFQHRMAFWNLFYKLNEKSQKGYRNQSYSESKINCKCKDNW